MLDQIENPGRWPFSLSLSDDGKRLGMSLGVTIDRTAEMRIVDLESGNILLKIPCALTEGNSGMMIRLSPDGKLAITATLWNQDPQGHWLTAQLRIDDVDRQESASGD